MRDDPPDDDDLTEDLEPADEVVSGEPLEEEPSATTEELTVVSSMSTSIGPFPDKEWIEMAEAHNPGVTKDLVKDFVDQRKHLRNMDRRAARLDEKSFEKFAEYQNTQLALAAVIALVIAIGGVVLTLAGESLYGLALLVFEIAGLLLVFMRGKSRGDAPPPQPSQEVEPPQ
ncbi:MAG: hypothetical protein WKF96_22905 [Solirubrobacteraceae bacterium]